MTGRRRRARLLAAALSVCAMALAACGAAGGGAGGGTGGGRAGGGSGSAGGGPSVFGTMTEQEIANLERIVSSAESAAAGAERLPGAP